MDLDLKICGAPEVEALVNEQEQAGAPFHAVVSFEHPCDESVSVENGRAPRLAQLIGPKWAERQLILTCWDVEKPASHAPQRELVQKGIEHFDNWRETSGTTRVLVHCLRGKARSTGMGLVLLRHSMGPDTEAKCLERLLEIRPIAAPNLAIVQHGDILLGCEGKLVQVVLDDEGVSLRREEANKARARQIESLGAKHML